jgi:endonuclease-3
MPRESLQAKIARTGLIIRALKQAYPNAHCELEYSTPFELLIATILSAQSTDKQVNVVTKDLFPKYPTPKHFAEAGIHSLEGDLRRIGLFRNKARNIKACSQALQAKHGGRVPQTMAELIQLDGVGRKTANVVLGNAFQINEGVVVDTHVARLSQRLGLTRETKPEKIESDLQRVVPRDEWTLFSHLLIWHGRRRCYARNPECELCEIAPLCPSRGKAKLKP